MRARERSGRTSRWRVERRAALVGAVLAWVALAPEAARADERVDCANAYEQTQRLQQKSELIDALEAAERCARPSCPDLLKDECTKWSTDIRGKLPKIIVRVRASDGCDRSDAKINVAGKSRRDADVEGLLVDPGVHDVEVLDPITSVAKTQKINFAPGERRDIDVDFSSEGAVCGNTGAKGKPRQAVPALTLILGSIGGGFVIAGSTLGIIGAVKRGDLDECKPNCDGERIDSIRPFFVAGDVLAGIGILTLGAAVVTFFSVPKGEGAAAPSRPPRARVFVGPFGVSGSF